MAGKINEALKYCTCVPTDGEQPVNATELSVARKFRDVSTSRAGCTDYPPNWLLIASEAPNDDFLLNILKAFLRLSRVLLDLEKCILSGAKKFVSVRSS